MDISRLRQKFLDYFSSLDYQIHLPAPLIPNNDPTVLFTTAGMQQFKPYYTSPKDAPAPKLVNIQPVIRTSDIAEVGDDTHLTMFEMLGIFSFGETDSRTMKENAIPLMWRFINEELGVNKGRVYATIFQGDHLTPIDSESAEIWENLGIEVRQANREENFWGPTGDEGPCGPTTEIYIDGVEVGNLVFNEYFQARDGSFTRLEKCGLDFGSGLERLSATLQRQTSVWAIEPFSNWIKSIDPNKEKESRVIVDHLRALIFLISAGIVPANKGREYVLRRLIRKAVFVGSKIEPAIDWQKIISNIRHEYVIYDVWELEQIWTIFVKEKEQFEKNLARAEGYLQRWLQSHQTAAEKEITELAFYMYESFGFPKELVIEYLADLGRSIDVDHFEKLFQTHQEISRAGLEKQFKGGLADHEEPTIKHHTAHHLLLAALRQVLGETVVQKGSNVTSDRLRIDFSFDRKLTEGELKQVEAIVNEKIQADLPVVVEEMTKDEALKSGALAEFGQKYGDKVTVYSIGDFSKELCGGPHIERTGQLGRFEILKEEASSQGIRRIKAKLS